MRISKKIVWAVLALLPLLPLLILILGNLGNQTGLPEPAWGTITIERSGDYIVADVSSDTLMDTLVSPFLPSRVFKVDSFTGIILNLLFTFQSSLSMPLSLPIVFGTLYLFYLAFIELISLAVDILLIIPNLCKRMLHGVGI